MIVKQRGRLLMDGLVFRRLVAMNHLVPYCAAPHSAVRNEMNHRGRP